MNLGKIEKYCILMNLPLVSMSMSDIFEIDVATVIFSAFHINFTKIHTDSEVVLSITLLFDRMLSLVKDFIKCHELHNFTIISEGN